MCLSLWWDGDDVREILKNREGEILSDNICIKMGLYEGGLVGNYFGCIYFFLNMFYWGVVDYVCFLVGC